MQISSGSDLYNIHVQHEASEAFLNKNIGQETYKNILITYTSSLYTPNFFIRLALALLTLVAILFSGLLLALIFEMSMVPMFFFLGIVNYTALEVLVGKKLYYNAGVDNLLMFFSAAFIVSAFAVNEYADQNIAVSGVAMLVCLYLAIRFVDGFMAVLSYLALLVFVFLLYTKLGSIAKATAPFLMIMISAAFYALMKKLIKNEKLLLYRYCCKCVLQVSLLTFYAAGNYFVIKELSNEMFDLHLALTDPIPLGWLFWILTFVIPITYVGYGIKKKDLAFIRTGLVLVATTVFTFRYYYHVIPVEIALLAGGALLIAISYAIIKYLKTPKYGFSFDKNTISNKERIDLKELIIAQVSGQKSHSQTGVEFGGGSFGSGGAGGNY
ncbi:MAG: hypothetical protein JWQ09_5662 [Segetibacter sp.]|nr:hypothetical protein [Segetibacter sp.]